MLSLESSRERYRQEIVHTHHRYNLCIYSIYVKFMYKRRHIFTFYSLSHKTICTEVKNDLVKTVARFWGGVAFK